MTRNTGSQLVAVLPRILPWLLACGLLLAQTAAASHKAQLDAHDVGKACQVCLLIERDLAPPPAQAGQPGVFALPAGVFIASVPLAPAERPLVLPPSRAPPATLY